MLCFLSFIYAVYAVELSSAMDPDYIIVKSSTDLRRNFTVNVTGTVAKSIYFFRNQDQIGSCVEKTCHDFNDKGLSCELTNMFLDSNNWITVQLTIKNIQRTTWDENISVSNGTNLNSARYFKQVYRLIIYTEIEHIGCHFQAVKEGIRMICSAPDIFPSAYSFSIFNNTRRINGSCEEINSTEVGFLKNVACSFIITKDQLRVGNTPIHTTMYLNITGDETTDINFGTNRSTILHLENPAVTLGAECNETYILEGQTGQCTCHRTDTSNATADIVWYYPNNSIAANGSTLTFTAARNSKFECISSFPFGWSTNFIYKPKVAYGPDSLHCSLYPSDEDIHLCDDRHKKETKITIHYECTVLDFDVKPSVSIEVRINNSVLKSSTKIYNVADTISLEKGGAYNFSCIAKNSEFGIKNVSQIHSKNIIEAPNAPKIYIKQVHTITNVNTPTSTKSTTYIIQCEVIGGYPSVSNITLECGSYMNESINSNSTTLAVHSSTPDFKDVNCSCNATHISTCFYRNTTVKSLHDLLIALELAESIAEQETAHCCFTRKGVLIFSLIVVLFVLTLVCVITHYKYGWMKCLLTLTHKQTDRLDAGLSVSYTHYDDIEMVTIPNHHYNQLGDTETGDMDNLSHHYSHVETQVPLGQAGDPSVTRESQDVLASPRASEASSTSERESVLDAPQASERSNSYATPTGVGEPNTDTTNRTSQATHANSDGYITIIDHYSNID